MRVIVLILGTLGGLAGALLGMNWISQHRDLEQLVARPDIAEVVSGENLLSAEIEAAAALSRASYVLVAGLFLAIGGGIMAMRKRGRIAAALMLAAPIVAAAMAPRSLVASGLLIIAGLLALRVKG